MDIYIFIMEGFIMKGKSIIPAKTLTLIQSIVCLIIMLAVVCLSFGTIFTVELNKDEGTTEMFNSIVNGISDEENVELPDTVEVNAPFVIASFKSLGDIIKSATSAIKNAADVVGSASDMHDDFEDENYSDLEDDANDMGDKLDKTQESIDDLSASLKSEGFVGLIALVTVIAQAFGESFLLGLIYIALIVMSIILPLVAALRFLIALIGFLTKLGNPGEGYSKVVKSFGAVFGMFPVLWLLKIIAPQITFGGAVTTMVTLLIVGLALNLVASRLKGYNDTQFKYINALQATSLAGVIGYFVFMLNIEGSHLFDTIFGGIGEFSKNAEAGDVALVVLLLVVMIGLLFSTCDFIKDIACRLCCMTPAPKKKKDGTVKRAKDSHIANTAMSLALIIIPVVLMVTSFELDLGDNMGSFVLFAIGIVVMLASEIVLVSLKKGLKIEREDVYAVLTGCPDEIEAPVAEEAPVEEAVAEEVVVEEVAAEEVAAEEVVTEEVAAEEVVTEEAVAEEAVVEEAVAEEVATEEVAAEETTNDAE